MCSYTYSSSGVLIYNMLRSQLPFILQLSSRLRHPGREGKRSTCSGDGQTEFQRSCPGSPGLGAPFSSVPQSPAPINLYFKCLSLLLPCKAFSSWSLSPCTSRSRFYPCHPSARRGGKLPLGTGFALQPCPCAERPSRTERCESRGRLHASPPLP